MNIFISYRRDDSRPFAELLHKMLLVSIPGCVVFLDSASVRAGRYPEQIFEGLASSTTVLALIGGRWRDRLTEPEDWVRLELEMALASDKLILPILLDGQAPPRGSEVPPSISELCAFQALQVLTEAPEQAAEMVRAKLQEHASLGVLGSIQPDLEAREEFTRIVSGIEHQFLTSGIDLHETWRVVSELEARREERRLEPGERASLRDALQILDIFECAGTSAWRLAALYDVPTSDAVRNGTARAVVGSAVRLGFADPYALQNAGRALRDVESFLRFDPRLLPVLQHRREQRFEGASKDARLLIAAPTQDDGIGVYESKDLTTFTRVGEYGDSAAGLQCALRWAATSAEPKLYGRHSRGVLRWTLRERKPQVQWGLPDSDVSSCFHHHHVIPSSCAELMVHGARRRWLKIVGRPGLVETHQIPHALARCTFGVDQEGRVITVWERDGVAHVERLGSDGSADVKMVQLRGAIAALASQGAPVIDEIRLDTYKGRPCFLLRCALNPSGHACLFVDAVTGNLRMPPVIMSRSLRQPKLMEAGSRCFLLGTMVESSQGVVAAWDVSDPTVKAPSEPRLLFVSKDLVEPELQPTEVDGEPLCLIQPHEGGHRLVRFENEAPSVSPLHLEGALPGHVAIAGRPRA